MKKTIAIIGLVMTVALSIIAQDTPQEQDFISRLEAFQKAGDMDKAQLQTIWYASKGFDDGMILLTSKEDGELVSIILEGIKSVKFVEISPTLKKLITKGLQIEGGSYIPNLEPYYKYVKVEYQTPVKNGSTELNVFIGMQDGKLMIYGYKKNE